MRVEHWLTLGIIFGPIITGISVALITKRKSPEELSDIIMNAAKTAVETAEIAHEARVEQFQDLIRHLNNKVDELSLQVQGLRRMILRTGGDPSRWREELEHIDRVRERDEHS